MNNNLKDGDKVALLKDANSSNLSDHLLKIGQDCAAHLKEPFLTREHSDLLYDDKGTPN